MNLFIQLCLFAPLLLASEAPAKSYMLVEKTEGAELECVECGTGTEECIDVVTFPTEDECTAQMDLMEGRTTRSTTAWILTAESECVECTEEMNCDSAANKENVFVNARLCAEWKAAIELIKKANETDRSTAEGEADASEVTEVDEPKPANETTTEVDAAEKEKRTVPESALDHLQQGQVKIKGGQVHIDDAEDELAKLDKAMAKDQMDANELKKTNEAAVKHLQLGEGQIKEGQVHMQQAEEKLGESDTTELKIKESAAHHMDQGEKLMEDAQVHIGQALGDLATLDKETEKAQLDAKQLKKIKESAAHHISEGKKLMEEGQVHIDQALDNLKVDSAEKEKRTVPESALDHLQQGQVKIKGGQVHIDDAEDELAKLDKAMAKDQMDANELKKTNEAAVKHLQLGEGQIKEGQVHMQQAEEKLGESDTTELKIKESAAHHMDQGQKLMEDAQVHIGQALGDLATLDKETEKAQLDSKQLKKIKESAAHHISEGKKLIEEGQVHIGQALGDLAKMDEEITEKREVPEVNEDEVAAALIIAEEEKEEALAAEALLNKTEDASGEIDRSTVPETNNTIPEVNEDEVAAALIIAEEEKEEALAAEALLNKTEDASDEIDRSTLPETNMTDIIPETKEDEAAVVLINEKQEELVAEAATHPKDVTRRQAGQWTLDVEKSTCNQCKNDCGEQKTHASKKDCETAMRWTCEEAAEGRVCAVCDVNTCTTGKQLFKTGSNCVGQTEAKCYLSEIVEAESTGKQQL